MINLIPPDARKNVRIEYWLRVLSVWLLLGVAAGAAVLVLLFPTYILLDLQLQVREESYQKVEVEQESFAKAQAEIRAANQNAKLLADASEALSFTTVLEALDAVDTDTIFVEQISLQREVETAAVRSVTIRGEATTRDALADFRGRLEASPQFSAAELPLENLARDREVPFSIMVTIAEPTL